MTIRTRLEQGRLPPPKDRSCLRRASRPASQVAAWWRCLDARRSSSGDLWIEGEDLGPATGPVTADGEYEWVWTVTADKLPELLRVLGAEPGANVLDGLASRRSGAAFYDLEKRPAAAPATASQAVPSPPQPNLSAGPRTHLPIEVLRRPVESAMEPGLRQGSDFRRRRHELVPTTPWSRRMDSAVVSTFTSG